jgi:hypothetical protein
MRRNATAIHFTNINLLVLMESLLQSIRLKTQFPSFSKHVFNKSISENIQPLFASYFNPRLLR